MERSVQGIMETAEVNKAQSTFIDFLSTKTSLRWSSWMRLVKSVSYPTLRCGGVSGGVSDQSPGCRVFFPSRSFAFARLSIEFLKYASKAIFSTITHLFWNQICVCRSCMPNRSEISLRRAAVGLLSDAKKRSRCASCSGVTRERLRFSRPSGLLEPLEP